jgi:hypothetical protein
LVLFLSTNTRSCLRLIFGISIKRIVLATFEVLPYFLCKKKVLLFCEFK